MLFTENYTQKVNNIEIDSKNSVQLLGIEIEITLWQVYCFLLEKTSQQIHAICRLQNQMAKMAFLCWKVDTINWEDSEDMSANNLKWLWK